MRNCSLLGSNAMTKGDTPTLGESVEIAEKLTSCDEIQRAEIFHNLRQTMQLSRTMRGLNSLIEQPVHRPLGQRALQSIGLHLAG
jgi:hypothetical protein